MAGAHLAWSEGVLVRRLLVVATAAGAAAAGATAAVLLLSGLVASAQEGPGEPAPRLVILARSDNPADALAAGPVGGALGAPVLLTPTAALHPTTAAALEDSQPDLVVLAGGTAALSEAVEQAVSDLGIETRRVAGADRHETAVLISALLSELHVPGDAGLAARIAALEARLAGVSRQSVEGQDTIRFEGVNVQVVNGTGTTDGAPNGLGNLLIGYSAQRQTPFEAADRSGSHYLVVGDRHEWTAFGGTVVGFQNTASGDWGAVSGGAFNTARGPNSSVSGGGINTASGSRASVSGGSSNTAAGSNAAVTGGANNTAGDALSSVSGGIFNETAFGALRASILGGSNNTLDSPNACHPSC